MGFFSKLLSRDSDDELVDDESLDDAMSLLVVFDGELHLDPEAVTSTLRRYSNETRKAKCELVEGTAEQGTPMGLIRWGRHAIRLVGFNLPMPAEVVEACVGPAHYGEEIKARARAHTAHVILYYAGREESLLERYVALAAVAGALAEHEAIAVLNETAHTSLPAEILGKGFAESDEDALDLLRSLPLPMLYVGLVKYEVEGTEGVWLRTYGAHQLALTDFAHLAESHDQATEVFELFSNLLSYQLSSGADFDAGHTAQVGEDLFIKLRDPDDSEYFLESDFDLYVIEFATESEMNA